MDAKTLKAAVMGLTDARAALWAAPVTAAMAEFVIDTPRRQAAFLAQCGHESLSFALLKELWGPEQVPAQARYEGSVALGNTEPGDGFKFRGRGAIQITGRANYRACGEALGLDFLAHPEILEGLPAAIRAAGWFWQSHGCNGPADSLEFTRLTKIINGGTNGLADRVARWNVAREALGA
jgi:putative chitinase